MPPGEIVSSDTVGPYLGYRHQRSPPKVSSTTAPPQYLMDGGEAKDTVKLATCTLYPLKTVLSTYVHIRTHRPYEQVGRPIRSLFLICCHLITPSFM